MFVEATRRTPIRVVTEGAESADSLVHNKTDAIVHCWSGVFGGWCMVVYRGRGLTSGCGGSVGIGAWAVEGVLFTFDLADGHHDTGLPCPVKAKEYS